MLLDDNEIQYFYETQITMKISTGYHLLRAFCQNEQQKTVCHSPSAYIEAEFHHGAATKKYMETKLPKTFFFGQPSIVILSPRKSVTMGKKVRRNRP